MTDIPLTQLAQSILSEHVQTGDTVVDATVGNGYDCLFLAKLVGESGRVYGFDVQQQALNACRDRLQKNSADKQVTLFHSGHEFMQTRIPDNQHGGHIKAIMFNLGYLPGSDKQCRTMPETTLLALNHSLQLLSYNGVISILAYTAHEGGQIECNAIKSWLADLDSNQFNIDSSKPEKTLNTPPELYILTKK